MSHATVKALSQSEVRALVQDCIDSGIQIGGPTIDELADQFAPESLLQIIRRRGFPVRLSASGDGVDFDDDIPLWLANALAIYGSQILELMRAEFLGVWR